MYHDYLLTTESTLPKVAEAVKNHHPAGYPGGRQQVLDDLHVGSQRLSGAVAGDPEGQASGGSDQPVRRTTCPRRGTEEVDAGLVKLMEDKKPSLVIWQTGTVDAMRSIDPDDFRSAIDEGVAALQKAGTDVVLMNLQYSPRTESMISSSPITWIICGWWRSNTAFRCSIVSRSCGNGATSGDFDFFASHGLNLAKQVHDCLGHALAKFVIGCGPSRCGATKLGFGVNEV